MKTKKQYYVEFVSPGTLFHETTRKPIEAWDTVVACSIAKTIKERYGARPFAFTFSTMLEAGPVEADGETLNVQPKELAKSGLHFLGGDALTFDVIEARADKSEEILRRNMRNNDLPVVVENRNSYKTTNEFSEKDVIVDPNTGAIVRRGNDADLVEYRAMMIAEWAR